MALITCKDVALGYDGQVVTEHISFSVNAGEYLCVVGENGAGKSTLIHALLKLKAPISGTITTGDGMEFSEIGYLPQQTAIQKDFPASVREIVISGCLNRCKGRAYYGKEEKKIAEENMEKLGIADISKRCYRELSGGQQQRVLLARALCAARRMILLDEPVAGLDPKATEEMYELIARLNANSKMAVVMVSHDIPSAVRYASHILHISRTPLFCGTKKDYIASDIGRAFSRIGGGGAR